MTHKKREQLHRQCNAVIVCVGIRVGIRIDVVGVAVGGSVGGAHLVAKLVKLLKIGGHVLPLGIIVVSDTTKDKEVGGNNERAPNNDAGADLDGNETVVLREEAIAVIFAARERPREGFPKTKAGSDFQKQIGGVFFVVNPAIEQVGTHERPRRRIEVEGANAVLEEGEKKHAGLAGGTADGIKEMLDNAQDDVVRELGGKRGEEERNRKEHHVDGQFFSSSIDLGQQPLKLVRAAYLRIGSGAAQGGGAARGGGVLIVLVIFLIVLDVVAVVVVLFRLVFGAFLIPAAVRSRAALHSATAAAALRSRAAAATLRSRATVRSPAAAAFGLLLLGLAALRRMDFHGRVGWKYGASNR